jgi:hypothetical protein
MKVVLAAEGTYPHQFGGVSVWCDQLIRGLPQHDFILIPLVATGNGQAHDLRALLASEDAVRVLGDASR